ncbi:hypothetical protein, partial [Bacteroides sp. An269]|uniref:hypothetical protein n=1 Tax=Bacteroides sp. An269 TaxID=1965613 RepID=UPI0019D1E255
PVLRQIARYLPHHRSENASKTHPKSSHDKFKTASKFLVQIIFHKFAALNFRFLLKVYVLFFRDGVAASSLF